MIKHYDKDKLQVILFSFLLLVMITLLVLIKIDDKKTEKRIAQISDTFYGRITDYLEKNCNFEKLLDYDNGTVVFADQICKLGKINFQDLHSEAQEIPEEIDLSKIYKKLAFKVEKVNGKTIVQIGCFGDCDIPTYRLRWYLLSPPGVNFLKKELEKNPKIIVTNTEDDYYIWK